MAFLSLLIIYSLAIEAVTERPARGYVHPEASPKPLQMSSLLQTGETELSLDERKPVVTQRLTINGKEVSAQTAGKIGIKLETGGVNAGSDIGSDSENAADSRAVSSLLDASEPVVTQKLVINGKEVTPEEAGKMGIQLGTSGVNAGSDTGSSNENTAGSAVASSSPSLPEQGSESGLHLKVNVKVRLHVGSCLPELRQDAASPGESNSNPSSFGCYDADTDGSIDDDEIKKLDADITSMCPREHARKADHNKDGKLSGREFHHMLTRLHICINISTKL
eukprot:TRINITY_DN23487_c0_g1_i1.p1 TRINITY_DN23487_c0_g1~~TRINITY_DN23487_c0_g1_i1.p1  ORF type:complete len:279 (-),score=58.37 TRINITY_DN23487_c0_g1_i1:161-997(-)